MDGFVLYILLGLIVAELGVWGYQIKNSGAIPPVHHQLIVVVLWPIVLTIAIAKTWRKHN